MSGGRIGLTRVAFGCADLPDLAARCAALGTGERALAHVPVSSRRVPRRDLSGGWLFWIIRHRLVARQAILGVDEGPGEQGSFAIIRLAPELLVVRPTAFRAHQGWRYIAEQDWPADLEASDGELPPSLAADLDALQLI